MCSHPCLFRFLWFTTPKCELRTHFYTLCVTRWCARRYPYKNAPQRGKSDSVRYTSAQLTTYCISNVIDGSVCAAVHDMSIARCGGYTGMSGGFLHSGHIFAYICPHTDERVSQVVYSHMGQFRVFKCPFKRFTYIAYWTVYITNPWEHIFAAQRNGFVQCLLQIRYNSIR